MRKRRIKILNNEYIIACYVEINKEKIYILAKRNYVIKYFYYLLINVFLTR